MFETALVLIFEFFKRISGYEYLACIREKVRGHTPIACLGARGS
jgi:hypothetical protein